MKSIGDIMTSEFLVRLPMERVAVLIGPKGSTKKRLEELTGCKLIVNSDNGNVLVIMEDEIDDPVVLWKARDMVKAIGRGFSPHKVYHIMRSDFGFELIQIRDIIGAKPSALQEVRSRVIGKKGRTRNTIEQSTGVFLSVFGNTISIIGEFQKMHIVRDAVIQLINGSKHTKVYGFIERKMRELKENKEKMWIATDSEEDLASISDLNELERIVFEQEKQENKSSE